MDHETLPKLQPNGAYDRDSLRRFLHRARGYPIDEIARMLRVETHRVIYLMGDGYPFIMRGIPS